MSLSSNPGNGDIEWKDGRDITLLYNHAAVSSMKFLLLLPWKVSLHWDHTGIFFYFSNYFFFAFLFGYFVKSTMLNHIFLVRKSACLWSKWKAEEQALSSTVLNIVVRLSSYKKKKIIVKSTNSARLIRSNNIWKLFSLIKQEKENPKSCISCLSWKTNYCSWVAKAPYV